MSILTLVPGPASRERLGATLHRVVSRPGVAPRFRNGAPLRAKVLLDRAACALRFALSQELPQQEWSRIVRETRQARELWEARGWIERPQEYHVEPPPLRPEAVREVVSSSASYSQLSFVSEYEPHEDEPGRERWLAYEANRTAHASVFRHPGASRPWVVCIHGYGFGIPFFDQAAFRVAWLHEVLGLNVVLPVLPLHGPRKKGWQSGDGFFAGDVLDTLHAETQAIWDMRRLLSWIRMQDSSAIGAYGLSLGAYNAALLAAFDDQLACVIAGVPATDFVRLGRLHSGQVAQQVERAGLVWQDVYRLYEVISPLTLPCRVPRDRRSMFAGLADCVVPRDQIRDLWRHWDRPRMLWYEGSHLSFPFEPSVQRFVEESLREGFQT